MRLTVVPSVFLSWILIAYDWRRLLNFTAGFWPDTKNFRVSEVHQCRKGPRTNSKVLGLQRTSVRTASTHGGEADPPGVLQNLTASLKVRGHDVTTRKRGKMASMVDIQSHKTSLRSSRLLGKYNFMPQMNSRFNILAKDATIPSTKKNYNE